MIVSGSLKLRVERNTTEYRARGQKSHLQPEVLHFSKNYKVNKFEVYLIFVRYHLCVFCEVELDFNIELAALFY